jgi:hypothetical protein
MPVRLLPPNRQVQNTKSSIAADHEKTRRLNVNGAPPTPARSAHCTNLGGYSPKRSSSGRSCGLLNKHGGQFGSIRPELDLPRGEHPTPPLRGRRHSVDRGRRQPLAETHAGKHHINAVLCPFGTAPEGCTASVQRLCAAGIVPSVRTPYHGVPRTTRSPVRLYTTPAHQRTRTEQRAGAFLASYARGHSCDFAISGASAPPWRRQGGPRRSSGSCCSCVVQSCHPSASVATNVAPTPRPLQTRGPSPAGAALPPRSSASGAAAAAEHSDSRAGHWKEAKPRPLPPAALRRRAARPLASCARLWLGPSLPHTPAHALGLLHERCRPHALPRLPSRSLRLAPHSSKRRRVRRLRRWARRTARVWVPKCSWKTLGWRSTPPREPRHGPPPPPPTSPAGQSPRAAAAAVGETARDRERQRDRERVRERE